MKMDKDSSEITDSGCSDLSEEDLEDPAPDLAFHHNLIISSSYKKDASTVYSDISKLGEFMRMPQGPDQVQCTYIWIDGSGMSMRLKDSTMSRVPQSLNELPIWTFDGSSTGQAKGRNSDVLLRPVALFKDPLRGGQNRLVLCETLDHNQKPIPSNKRSAAAAQLSAQGSDQSAYIIRQMFQLLDRNGQPAANICRHFGQIVHDACVYAGVKMQPLESGNTLSIGPCRGLEAGDHLWMTRFLLHRIAEDFNLAVELLGSTESSPGLEYLEERSLLLPTLAPDEPNAATVYDFSQGVSNGVVPQHPAGCFQQESHGIHCTYVWVEDSLETMRARTRVFPPGKLEDIPKLRLQRGSTELVLVPVTTYRDPFKGGDHKLVLCEVCDRHGSPTGSNLRASCAAVMDSVAHLQPWFGIEQEYVLFKGPWPLGWSAVDPPQGSEHYCGLGAAMLGRHIAEAHYRACLYAGIKIAGTNAEVLTSQWEFQVGPCTGITAGDDLWMARFLLHVVAQYFGMSVSLDPKPVPGECNGSGAHTNFSTAPMRAEGGIREIDQSVKRLSRHHLRHIAAYDPHQGRDNLRRLTGGHETANIDTFSSGVADRGVSIRIPRQVALEGKGYFEDRRPSSNCDPYSVTEVLVRTAVLDQ